MGYRQLNEVTVKDTYPLQLIEDNLAKLADFKVKYLGHLMSADGIKPIPAHLLLVRDWSSLTTRSQVRIFLGKISYQCFVKNYAAIAGPLRKRAGKGTAEEEREKFELTSEMQKVFQELKQWLTEALILAYPRFHASDPFVLDTDLSQENNAIGGLVLRDENGRERVTIHGVKELSATQAKYSSSKGGLLIIFQAVEVLPQVSMVSLLDGP